MQGANPTTFTPLYVNLGLSSDSDCSIPVQWPTATGPFWRPGNTSSGATYYTDNTSQNNEWGIVNTGATYNLRDPSTSSPNSLLEPYPSLSPLNADGKSLFGCRVYVTGGDFRFLVEVPNSTIARDYNLTLLFLEAFFNTGGRTFNIGYGLGDNPTFLQTFKSRTPATLVPTNFDIVANAYGRYRALRTNWVVTVPAGQTKLNIILKRGTVDNPIIMGIGAEQQ